MRPYFEKMPDFGKALKKGQLKRGEENEAALREVEQEIYDAVDAIKNSGFSEEKINARGQMTVWQRLEYLVDPGTWCPLHTLYNPADNEEGTTNVIDGLGNPIDGKGPKPNMTSPRGGNVRP